MEHHDLTQGSIKRHIANIAIPSMVGSVFMTFYNVVDTIWAGKLDIDIKSIYQQHSGNILEFLAAFFKSSGDSRALSALSITFPIYLIVIALAIGAMSGSIGLIGNALGKKDKEAASTFLVQAFFYAIIASITLILVIPLFPLVMQLLNVQDEVVKDLAKQYIHTIIIGGIFFSAAMVCNAGLTSRGDTKTQRNVSIFTFFLNIILDPLFMFGFGPIPKMGIAGIALATVCSQAIGFFVYIFKLKKYKAFAGMTTQCWVPRVGVLKQIAQQSLPTTTSMFIVAFLLGTVNGYALRLGGAAAAAAYGVALRIEQIALIPSMGISTAISSIGSQNNGAGFIDRIRETYRSSLFVAIFLWLALLIPLTQIFPREIIRVFTSDPEVIEIGVSYLKVCFFIFYAYMLLNFTGSVFTSLKKPHWFAISAFIRNVILPFVTFPLLSARFGLKGVWYGIFVNNWLVAIFVVVVYFVLIKKREKEVLADSSS